MSGLDTRRKYERDSMRPDSQTLAATYRLNLMPKKRSFALVKKPRKKEYNASSLSDGKSNSANTTKDDITLDSTDGGHTNTAVYIRTSCWKIDEGAEDDAASNDDDYDDDLRPDSTHSTVPFQAQQTYHTMCKVLCIRPLKSFQNALLTDQVSVCYQTLNPDDVKACVTALVHTDNVEKVIFDDNNLGPLGTARIAEILPQKFEFRELTIRNNKIGTEGARLLCDALLNNNYIRKLDLSGNDFCEEDGEVFGELIEENHALREINLSHNNFRCRGGKMIADGLAKNRFLKKLDLSWNHLRMDGAVALGESLMENSDLEELSVAWNGFHLRGCMALGHALKHNSSLIHLDLTCNRVSELCLAQLLKGIKENSTLQVLKLPLNPLSPQSAYSILQFIDQNESIALNLVDLGEKEETNELDENPLIVLMEFCRLQNLRLVDMFNIIDTDNSKSLTYDEFISGLKNVNIPLADSSLKNLLKMLDKNGDGSIDFRELNDGQKMYKKLVQEALKDGPMDSNIIGQIGFRMKQHIKEQYLLRKF